jgi:hypothetical protein
LKYQFQNQVDRAANQSEIWRPLRAASKTFAIGSHFNSVKTDGRFDGSLGVIIAYDVMLITLRTERLDE